MKRMIVAMMGVALLSGAGLSAQDKKQDGTVYYGCLVPGAQSDSYKLVNAREKGQKSKEKATYELVSDKKLRADHFLTMEVEVTGTVSGQTLTVTKIKRRADFCG